jgi:phosphoglucosamine mutase
VLAVVVQRARPASEVLQVFHRLPQRLKNVRFKGVSPLRQERVQAAIRQAELRLSSTGRVLIRESGTEPLVRVMVEGEDSFVVAEIVDSLCELIAEAAGHREPAF